jgi:DNA-binding Lrp family transcriptional regulator
MDTKDKAILNALLSNGRLSYRQIASKLKLATATVMHRVKALEKEGCIRGYTTQVDYEQLGYEFKVIVEARLGKGTSAREIKQLTCHPYVSNAYDTMGEFNVMLFSTFQTKKELNAFLKKVQSYVFVEEIKTRLVLGTRKEEQVKIS